MSITYVAGASDANKPPVKVSGGTNAVTSATIASGASLSDAIDIGANHLFAIQMPSGWTAASITLQGSADGVTYDNIYDSDGAEVSLTVAASRYVVVSAPIQFIGIRYLKLRSGTAGSPVNQAADRTIKLVVVA